VLEEKWGQSKIKSMQNMIENVWKQLLQKKPRNVCPVGNEETHIQQGHKFDLVVDVKILFIDNL